MAEAHNVPPERDLPQGSSSLIDEGKEIRGARDSHSLQFEGNQNKKELEQCSVNQKIFHNNFLGLWLY